MRWTRAPTSIRSCSRCATSTSSTTDAVPPFDKLVLCLFNSCQQHGRTSTRERHAMKLYDSIGPNPRVVRMFMAEKGIEIPKQAVDLRKGENREAEHLKRNPHGQMPT